MIQITIVSVSIDICARIKIILQPYNLILSVLYDIDLNKTFKNKNNRTLSRVVSEQLCSRYDYSYS